MADRLAHSFIVASSTNHNQGMTQPWHRRIRILRLHMLPGIQREQWQPPTNTILAE